LTAISDETEAVVVRGKLLFQLPRPYQVDPTLPHCGKGGSAAKAYPSGHAGSGYSVGWTLARLLPERAPALLQRAQD
jgi:acid phosphatase (class A)